MTKLFCILAMLSILISLVCSFTAQVKYFRSPQYSGLIGFGFARYYYGELRRNHLPIFLGSIGGIVVALLFIALAFFVKF